MQIDTFSDIIRWTKAYHQQLADSLHNSQSSAQDDRARLMLDYLSDHEARAAKAVEAFEHSDNLKALNTWIMEFMNKEPLKTYSELGKPFAGLSAEEIVSRIEEEHQQIIELYRYLLGRTVATPAADLLRELIALEEHDAMQLSQGANQINDM